MIVSVPDHCLYFYFAPYETHVAMSSVLPDERQDEMMKRVC